MMIIYICEKVNKIYRSSCGDNLLPFGFGGSIKLSIYLPSGQHFATPAGTPSQRPFATPSGTPSEQPFATPSGNRGGAVLPLFDPPASASRTRRIWTHETNE